MKKTMLILLAMLFLVTTVSGLAVTPTSELSDTGFTKDEKAKLAQIAERYNFEIIDSSEISSDMIVGTYDSIEEFEQALESRQLPVIESLPLPQTLPASSNHG